MELGRIAYKNITQSPAVQTRLQIVRQALGYAGDVGGSVYSKSIMEVMRFQARVRELDPGRKSVYACSSGDLSHFMFATGKKEFFCFDMLPFFNDLSQGLGWLLFGESPIEVLVKADQVKRRRGHWHNEFIKVFNETGIFMLFEVLGLGGQNPNVFEAQGIDGLYKINFDLQSERYCVHFKQANLQIGNEISLLEPSEIGLLMVKAGDGAGLANLAYEFLEQTVIPGLMPGALIFTDRSFNHDFLETLFQRSRQRNFSVPQRIDDYGKYGQIQFLYRVRITVEKPDQQ